MTVVGAESGVFEAARGEGDALARLVRVHHDRVVRFGLRVCNSGFDAEDAVQEAFEKLARRPDIVARESGALTWLFVVVRNACRRLLRPFRRQSRVLGQRVDEAEIPGMDVSPEDAVARFELVGRTLAAIAELEPPYREVLILRDLEGLGGPEVCARLGVAEATMKTRLHRARAMLRQVMLASPTERRTAIHR